MKSVGNANIRARLDALRESIRKLNELSDTSKPKTFPPPSQPGLRLVKK